MTAVISRMQFLRGDLSGGRKVLRPPWALAENLFTSLCDRCGACIQACPENLLSPARGGFPQIDFTHGECTFCAACLQSCSRGALRQQDAARPWSLLAVIGSQCLLERGVTCLTCGEQCETRAIRIPPGARRPQFDPALCNGCGACVRPCPSAAIQIRQQESSEVAV